MPVIASQMVAKVATEGSEEANAKLLSVGATSDSVGAKIGAGLKTAAFIGGAGLLAAGIMATKMAGDFQAGVTQIITGAGEFESNRKLISDGILKMAVDTGTSTKQLTDGLYMIESAGYHGAAGLAVLQAAAEGAKVGNADLGTVADGVTTIMTDYANKHVTAAQATNLLIATVAAGKTHMTDLASALAMVLPTASAIGVQLKDVAGAMATMTSEGVPAADAATYLRQLLMALEAPASSSAKTLKEIGLSASDVANEMKISLPATLQMIEDHLKAKFPEGSAAYIDALKNIAGGSKQMQGILDLTGQHLDTFKSNVSGVTDAVKKGGTQITGWALVQKDFNQQADHGREVLETLGIKIGTALLPVAGDLFDKVANGVQQFADWAQKSGFANEALSMLKDVIGETSIIVGDLVGGLESTFTWLSQNQWAFDILKGAAIAVGLAIAGIKLAGFINDLATTSGKVIKLTGDFLGWAGGIKDHLWSAISGIGTKTAEAEATVATETAIMETDIAAVGAAAETTAGEEGIGKIGPAMTTEAGTVATESTAMEGSFAAIAGAGGIGLIVAALATLGPLAYQAGQDMVKNLKSQLQQMEQDIKNKKAAIEQALTYQVNLQMDILRAQYGLPSTAQENSTKSIEPAPTILKPHAAGILNNPVGHWGLVGEKGPEPMWIPPGASILPSGTAIPGASGGSAQPQAPLYLQIDGQTFGRLIMPYHSSTLRVGLGMTGV